ncbi:helicase associated domain-containing protein [Pseudarthrobacter sp. BIM B-2242]|uniref:helicase associated domain-containing protein n=1 Tax=Pseudarthrobacter sp. BIM B-2242 TaxID=2772401 RepID=UPI00168BEF03|nr:helicase associated domain-containing protein [Pseudarthrobacter sp. BIM B-2242]QOD05970.1 helicase associated domain-containing protein [Pseudarthrobacter sp. BIM B-2242]
MPPLPRSANWDERCAHLARWVEVNGRVPSQMSDDATERSCYSWLTTNRKRLKAGKLTDEQARLFKALPVPQLTRNTIEDRLNELEAFYAKHKRLPLTTAVEPAEKSLSTYLVGNLRRKISKGTLDEGMLARARAIPGVDEISIIPDQDETLEELFAYAAQHGHMPPFRKPDGTQEARLSSWVRNNTRGNPQDKSPALRARHEAILVLIARYPGASEAEREQRPQRRELQLRELESFVKEHGHLPVSTKGVDETSKRLTASVELFRREMDEGRLEPGHEVRVKAVLDYPSHRDYEWQANFEALVQYAAAHDGRLPGTWAAGKLFSWLTFQRRHYRNGMLSHERLEKLLTLDGFIPGMTAAAAKEVHS